MQTGPNNTGPNNDRLGKAEIRKDALQDGVTAASQAVGTVSTIITSAVGDIARAIGGFATEIFEIRDAARKAGRDHTVPGEVVEPSEPGETAPADQPNDI